MPFPTLPGQVLFCRSRELLKLRRRGIRGGILEEGDRKDHAALGIDDIQTRIVAAF
jgi:hypothetical protein